MKGQMWHQNSCGLDGKVEPLDTFLFYILFAVLQNHMELLSILLSSTILSTWQYFASVSVVIETNNFWVWKSVEMFKLTFYNHSNSNMTWKYKICFEGMQKDCFVKALFDQSHWWNSHWSVDGCECFSSTNSLIHEFWCWGTPLPKERANAQKTTQSTSFIWIQGTLNSFIH